MAKQDKQELYETLSQVFETYRWGEVSAGHSWNQPVQELQGLTMRYLGTDHLQLTHHRYETTTVEGLARLQQDEFGPKFLKQVSEKLKKEFKKETGYTLKLKPIKEDPWHVEKVGRVTAESSWMLGASRYGHGMRPVGRYLIRSSCVYDFSSES